MNSLKLRIVLMMSTFFAIGFAVGSYATVRFTIWYLGIS